MSDVALAPLALAFAVAWPALLALLQGGAWPRWVRTLAGALVPLPRVPL